jgi:hypothetical protein
MIYTSKRLPRDPNATRARIRFWLIFICIAMVGLASMWMVTP